MKFTPKNEDELRPPVLAPGEYDALVKTATDEVSKSQNEMIKLMLVVWDNDGESTAVFDYLLDAMPVKLRHFCVAAGIEKAYDAGELTADLCQEQNVRVKLKIEEGNGEWPRSNKVVDYLAPDSTVDRAAPTAAAKPSQTQEQPAQEVADAENPF